MAFLELKGVEKVLRRAPRHQGHRPHDREGRVRRVRGAVGLRQVDAAAADRGAGERSTAAPFSWTGATSRRLPSSKRDLAMVFQSYALYPHMSVYDNMSFALHAGEDRSGGDPREGRARRQDPQPRRLICSARRRSCRAGSGSAWRSAGRSCARPRCSCSTSRCPTWTPRCAGRHGWRSRSCTALGGPKGAGAPKRPITRRQLAELDQPRFHRKRRAAQVQGQLAHLHPAANAAPSLASSSAAQGLPALGGKSAPHAGWLAPAAPATPRTAPGSPMARCRGCPRAWLRR